MRPQDSKPQRVPIFKQGCSPCKVQEIVRAWQALSEVKVVQVGQRKREKAGQILKRSRRRRKASKTKQDHKGESKRQGRDSMRLTAAGKHREVREPNGTTPPRPPPPDPPNPRPDSVGLGKPPRLPNMLTGLYAHGLPCVSQWTSLRSLLNYDRLSAQDTQTVHPLFNRSPYLIMLQGLPCPSAFFECSVYTVDQYHPGWCEIAQQSDGSQCVAAVTLNSFRGWVDWTVLLTWSMLESM